jgi:cytochrome oxidase Cu insertion factor (SCO1/SenC/PrrC family)
MRKPILAAALALSLASAAALAQAPQEPPPPPPPPRIKVGDMAPDFTLRDQNGQEVSLASFRGKKNVVLAFYVFAFTGG